MVPAINLLIIEGSATGTSVQQAVRKVYKHMTQSLIPYDRPYVAPEMQVAIAGAQGVFLTLDADKLETTVATFERWFAGREDVLFVDYGTTDKTGLGFLIMEWTGYEIDPLFLSILDDADFIKDYTAYGREV